LKLEQGKFKTKAILRVKLNRNSNNSIISKMFKINIKSLIKTKENLKKWILWTRWKNQTHIRFLCFLSTHSVKGILSQKRQYLVFFVTAWQESKYWLLAFVNYHPLEWMVIRYKICISTSDMRSCQLYWNKSKKRPIGLGIFLYITLFRDI